MAKQDGSPTGDPDEIGAIAAVAAVARMVNAVGRCRILAIGDRRQG